MKNLKINSTPKTPKIDFDFSTGVFLFTGISVPENAMEFYRPLINGLKDYVKTPCKSTKVTFKLTYVNTSSLQYIYDLLMILDGLDAKTSAVNITWYYVEDDIDLKEMGEDFKEALTVDFSCFEVETVD